VLAGVVVAAPNVTGCWCISRIVCIKMNNKHKQTALDLDKKITALLPHGIIKNDDEDDWCCVINYTVNLIFPVFV